MKKKTKLNDVKRLDEITHEDSVQFKWVELTPKNGEPRRARAFKEVKQSIKKRANEKPS